MPGRGLAVLACRGALRGGAAGEALCAAVGLGGCRAVVACRWGRAEAFAWAGAGLARRWAFARPCRRGLRWGRGRWRCGGLFAGPGPGLGSALLAVVRFRGAARGPLRSAGRGALSCMGRAAGVRPAGGKQQSYKYSKKSMSRKHQSQHPLTTTRNFTSFLPRKLVGVACQSSLTGQPAWGACRGNYKG